MMETFMSVQSSGLEARDQRSESMLTSDFYRFDSSAITRSVIICTSASCSDEPDEPFALAAGPIGGGAGNALRSTPVFFQLSRKMSFAQMSQFLYSSVLRGSDQPHFCFSSSSSRSLSSVKKFTLPSCLASRSIRQ